MISVLLPLPDTPVTQVKVPSGMLAVTFCRLLLARALDRQPAVAGVAGGSRRDLGDRDLAEARQVLAGQAGAVAHHLLGRALGDRPCRHARRRPGPCRPGGRRRGSRPRHARPPAPCCRGRAAASASSAAGRCRAGAGRSTARRARRARRSGPSRSARPAGCAGSRRPTACPRCGSASGSRGRHCRGSPAAR